MKERHIYFAAPIHQKEDAEANELLIKSLRFAGHMVWSPQEAGIASNMAAHGTALQDARKFFCQKDLKGMQASDVCVAYLGRQRKPSEGMLWEMGWFYAKGIPVIFFNPYDNKITLMAEFTSTIVHSESELLEALESV